MNRRRYRELCAWFGWGFAVLSGFSVDMALGDIKSWAGPAVTAGLVSIYFFLREAVELIASCIAQEVEG